jgi:hypothetical protein
MRTESELRAAYSAAVRIIHVARGALRLLRPHVVERDASAHVQRLIDSNEAFARNRPEHPRVLQEVHGEFSAFRRLLAGVGL